MVSITLSVFTLGYVIAEEMSPGRVLGVKLQASQLGSSQCVIGGCNSELCVNVGSSTFSRCIFRPEYACYKTATCTVQANGSCGWTQTPELLQCIQNARQPSPTPSPSSTPNLNPNPIDSNTKTLRVIEVRYFPSGVTPLYQPDTLSSQLRTSLANASKFRGYTNSTVRSAINVQVVSVYNRTGTRPNPDGTWEGSFKEILRRDDLCKVIADNDIDQVWLWVDPRAGVDTGPGMEYAISSPYFLTGSQHAVIPKTPFCNGRVSFVFMGLDYSRTVDLALHSFGHMMEALLSNAQSVELFWDRYAGQKYGSSNPQARALRCGNVHFPPNGATDYDYTNTTAVQTSCEDWNPDATGRAMPYSCSRWGCSQGGFLKWWFQNMPNFDSPLTYQTRKLPNWWNFTVDFDDVIKSYQQTNFYLNDPFFAGKTGPTNIDVSTWVTTKTGSNQTQVSWNHQASGANRIVVLSAVYRAHNNTSARITSATYNNASLTFIRRDKYHDFTTELWYLVNPPTTNSTVVVNFSANQEDFVLTATSLDGISQTTPIMAHAGIGTAVQQTTSQALTMVSRGDSVALGVLATYPDGGFNPISVRGDTFPMWINVTPSTNNIASSNGIEMVKSPSTSATLEWSSVKNWQWSASGVMLTRM